ncbi:hypothetical protein BS50DRAFT_675750 [Corynespora cassiicola Philippines]|uniref:RNI-like protein n=1 Tax=Corynespora cassiicola Philippines TaxID=1448308 RepID=A0A2T2NQI2_CORCC|nr:hypothetical protein BS50DRAFT_675750 [Corynespora cassiicola Philippines]
MPPVRTAKKNTVGKAGETPKKSTTLRADATEFQPGSSHHTVVKRETTEPEAGLDAGFINESVSAPSEPAPKKRKLKPTTTGEKITDFPSTKDWEDTFHILIGTSTRKIKLGTGFVLKDDHIDDLIICRGLKICEKIWEFHFKFGDVDYNATNSARNLTDAAVCRLAQACPNLKEIVLQDAANLTGESVKALLTHCPKLTSLEITGGKSSNSAFSPDIFDAICETPAMVPNLRKLFITQIPR